MANRGVPHTKYMAPTREHLFVAIWSDPDMCVCGEDRKSMLHSSVNGVGETTIEVAP